MRGLMAKPSGEIIETPITANFQRGTDASPILYLDARRKERSCRYGAEDSQFRIPYQKTCRCYTRRDNTGG
jgi:hypothetical protein